MFVMQTDSLWVVSRTTSELSLQLGDNLLSVIEKDNLSIYHFILRFFASICSSRYDIIGFDLKEGKVVSLFHQRETFVKVK